MRGFGLHLSADAFRPYGKTCYLSDGCRDVLNQTPQVSGRLYGG